MGMMSMLFYPGEVFTYHLSPGSHDGYYGGKPVTFRRDTPKIGRNDPCTCGSGKKFKKCCIDKGGDAIEGGDS